MKKIGIVGFRGYSGAELVQLGKRHGELEVFLMEHRDEKTPAKGAATMSTSAEAVAELGLDGVFLATPPEVSMELAGGYLAAGAVVVDLSGAFRLGTAENYQRWYKDEHTQPELLAEAVYSIPELHRDLVPGKRLISNPGCYPTAASLALAPLVDAIDRQAGVVCDAKSGVSGAGRKPSLTTHFCEVTENFSAYSILYHRHVAEVLQNTGLREAEFSFTAQLLPVHRGILETIYFRASEVKSAAELAGMYETRYGHEPFVRIHEPGKVPDLTAVARTNYCDIGVVFDGRTKRGVVVAAIDNLVKGAAGQAMQNMNLALGFPETQGLL
ncbi:MAG: N-acetyl-gamma-glutamyl-phosphate reductase [Acidobacteria bacterium]|nr:N-acetyl-gamma-glutamyl-phosphate reductase [Acidobacteriota bacterium]